MSTSSFCSQRARAVSARNEQRVLRASTSSFYSQRARTGTARNEQRVLRASTSSFYSQRARAGTARSEQRMFRASTSGFCSQRARALASSECSPRAGPARVQTARAQHPWLKDGNGTLIKATHSMQRLNLDFKGPLPSVSKNRFFPMRGG